MSRNTLLILPAFLLLIACSKHEEEPCAFIPDTKGQSLNLKFESLEDAVPAISTKQQLVDFFSAHPELRDHFFNRPAYPDDSTFVNELYHRFTSPHLDTLLMETKKIFGDLHDLKTEFEKAFINIRYYYPNFQPPKIETVISGLETDLFVSDTLIIVGLDYFLGPHAKYKPNMYEYMLRRYQKNFIVPSALLLFGIDSRLNHFNPNDRTVLAEMVTYGKAYYFAKQMMPCTPDSVFIAYTAEEMRGARENEGLIWFRLLEDQVIYQTSHLMKQKFIAERPKTLEVGEKCPGRIGTWVGWQIIKAYMQQHPDITLPQLMELTDADKIFKESKYKPDIPKVAMPKGLKPEA